MKTTRKQSECLAKGKGAYIIIQVLLMKYLLIALPKTMKVKGENIANLAHGPDNNVMLSYGMT